MSQYNSQLKGWAVDRTIELFKARGPEGYTVDDVLTEANKLVDYAYNPNEDFRDAVKRMVEILKQCDPENALLKVQELQAELAYIDEDLGRKIAMRETLSKAPANDPESQQA